jgi:regulatory protein
LKVSGEAGEGAGRTAGARPRRARKAGDGAGRPAPSTLSFEEQRPLAQESALRLLGVRERSAAELRTRLRQKGFAPDVVEGVLERLRENGLQDDARFADRFTEAAVSRGQASRRIRGDLLRKGLDRELAARAATVDPDEEEERARELAIARAGRMYGLTPEARARRLLSLLARRGYDPDVCRRVATEASRLADPADPGPGPADD